MEDEESQVRGFVHFADGAGVSFPHLTLFTPKEAVRIVKNGEVYESSLFFRRETLTQLLHSVIKIQQRCQQCHDGKDCDWIVDEKIYLHF